MLEALLGKHKVWKQRGNKTTKNEDRMEVEKLLAKRYKAIFIISFSYWYHSNVSTTFLWSNHIQWMKVFNSLYAIFLVFCGAVCLIKRCVFLNWWKATKLCKNVKFHSNIDTHTHTTPYSILLCARHVWYGVAYGNDVCKMQIKRCKSGICHWQTIGLFRSIVVVVPYWIYWMLHARW